MHTQPRPGPGIPHSSVYLITLITPTRQEREAGGGPPSVQVIRWQEWD